MNAVLIIHGLYRFRPRRVAFRNDYCLFCKQPGRSAQFRTFDAWHIFWIPLIPLGFRKRWLCTVCGREPHLSPGTRRGFKWAGLIILLLLAFLLWVEPLDPDILIFGWVVRIAAPLGAILTLNHLLRTPKDPSLKERLATIAPATDTVCPFCGSTMIVLASGCSCPTCGIQRV